MSRHQALAPSSRSARVGITLVLIALAMFAAASTASAAIGVSAFTLTPSTTATGANPDLTVSATRSGTSSDDVKQATLKLPAGAGYSVAGISTKCSGTQFNADSCPSGSKVGTATAQFDAGILGTINASGDVYATAAATAGADIGVIYRPSSLSKIFVKTTLGGAPATGVTLTTGDYPKTTKLLGLFTYDITISKLDFALKGKVGTVVVAKNPTACGSATSTFTYTPFSGTPASKTAAFTVTGCPVDVKPVVAINSGPAAGSLTNLKTAAFTFSSVPGTVTFECKLDAAAFSACASGQSYSNLADGSHTFVVRAKNGATYSDEVSRQWTVDATAPAAPAVTRSDPTTPQTQLTSQTILISPAEPGGTLNCTLDGAPYTPCAAGTITLTGLSAGVHVFSVSQTDAAGNTGSATSVTWQVIVPPPPPTIVGGPGQGSLTNSRTATFSFTVAAPGAVSYECRLDQSADAPCATPVTYTALADGTHTFCVRARSSEGLLSPEVCRTWTVDGTPPGPPAVVRVSPTANPTGFTSQTISITPAEAGGVLNCNLDGSPYTPCVAGNVTLSGLANGPHTFAVTQTDAAGNTGSSAAVTWTVGLPPPVPPTITSKPPSISNSPTATFAFTSTNSPVTFECRLDLGAYAACTSPKVYASLPDGVHAFYVRSRDAEGNASPEASWQWTVSIEPPPAPVLTSNRSGVTNLTTATLNVAGLVTGAVLQISNNGGATWSNAVPPIQLTGLANGNYIYIARQVDPAGNVGPVSNAVTWTVDTVAPPAPTLTSDRNGITNSTTATLTAGNLEPGAQLQLTSDGGSSWTNVTSPISLTGLNEGLHAYSVRQVDAAGNNSPWSTTVAWTVDVTAPPMPIVSTPPSGPATSVSITFSGEPGGTFQCSRDGGPFSNCVSPVALTGLTAGTHTFAVRQTDAANNVGPTRTVVWNVGGPPPPNTLAGDAPAVAPTQNPVIPVSTDTGTSYQCQINSSGAWSACNPNTGTYATSFNEDAANRIDIRAVSAGQPDLTPVTVYLWVSTAPVSSTATVVASDTRAGAHPTISGTSTLIGGYNPKTASVQMPAGLNGALSATSQKCDASGGDPEEMDCANTAPGSAIGTVSTSGVASTVGMVSDVTSTIYLTTPPQDSSSPAGVWVDLESPSHPELGHARMFGWVNIQQLDTGAINGEVRQSVTFPAIPERTSSGVRFHVLTVNMELLGDPPGGTYPLVTNPTTCGLHEFVGGGTTWSEDGSGGDGPEIPQITVEYPVTDCESLEFNPQISQDFFMMDPIDGSTYDPANPGASVVNVHQALRSNLAEFRQGVAGSVATVTNGEPSTTARKAAIRDAVVLQPQGTGANFAALAGAGATCPGSAASSTGIFDISQCSPGAQVGTVKIETPLLDQPLQGTVWLINNTPLPWLGFYISPESGPNNPAGVHLSMTATTDLTCAATAPSCTDATYKRVTVSLSNLPDVPFDKVTLDLSGRTARPLDNNGLPSQGLLMAMPDQGAAGCAPDDFVFSTMVSGEGASVDAAQATTMSNCASVTAAPTLTRTSPTATSTSQTTAQFNIGPTAPPVGWHYECRLDAEPWQTCPGGLQPPISVPTEGRHTYSVRVVKDDRTEASNIVSSIWTIDFTPPALTLSKNAANSGTVTFAWTRSENGSPANGFLCSKDGAAYTSAQCSPIVSASIRSGTQTWTNVLPGTHTFGVRIADPAGNQTTRTVTWTAGTLPPAPTVLLVSPATSPTSSTSAAVTISGAPAGATTQCSLNGGATWTACASPLTFSNLADGAYSVVARFVDGSGEIGQISNVVAWIVDTGPPAQPTLTLTQPATLPTSSTSATLTVSAVEPGGIIQYSNNGGSTWVNTPNPIQLTGLSGAQTWMVRVVDAAGNTSQPSLPVSWTIGLPPPSTPTLTRTQPLTSPSNSVSAVLTAGNVDAGATVQYSADAGATWTTASANPIALSALVDGSYTYVVRAVDTAGTPSAISNSVSWTVDTIPPAAPAVSTPALGPQPTTITFSVAEPAVAFECSLDGATFAPCVSPQTFSVSPGPHTFAVRGHDAAGNTGSTATVVWTAPVIDNFDPNTLIGDAPASAPNLTPVIPVSTDTGTSYECQLNNSGAWAVCDPNAGSYGITAVFDDNATNKVAIRAKNATGIDETPAVTYLWTSTSGVSVEASVTASDTRAGAHPTVIGTTTLNGGYNVKTVQVRMPVGLNGALTATSEKCDASGGDPETMNCAVSAPGSAIGTVSGTGVATTVGVVTDASSTIYLTTPPQDSTSPAGVWMDIKSPSHPELGHLRMFGWVSMVQIDSGVINGEISQSVTFPAIPERTSTGVRFHNLSVEMELNGDPPGGTFPLITNPTTCDAHSFVGGGTTWSEDGLGGDGPVIPEVTVDYPVTDCGTLEFTPQLSQDFYMMNPIDGSTYDPSSPSLSVFNVHQALTTNLTDFRQGVAGTVLTVQNGEPTQIARRSAIASMVALQPQGTGVSFEALSGGGATCPGAAGPSTGIFDASQCAAAARVGSISIDTPLFQHPLQGAVWLIGNTPLPWLGVSISPQTGMLNPAGVYLAFTGTMDLTCASTAPSCTDATYKRVTMAFNNLPDMPVNSISLDLSGRTAREADNSGSRLPGLILAMPDQSSAGCLATDNVYSTLTSGSGNSVDALQPTTMGNCTVSVSTPTLTRSPAVSPTNQASMTFTVGGAMVPAGWHYECNLDRATWYPCTYGVQSPVTVNTAGSHTYSVRAVADNRSEATSLANSTWLYDPVVPTMTLVKNAANSGTVTFAWTRSENGQVSCSKDGGTYLTSNCNPSAVTVTARSGTQSWLNVPTASGAHTFCMRTTDQAGNVSAPACVTWTA